MEGRNFGGNMVCATETCGGCILGIVVAVVDQWGPMKCLWVQRNSLGLAATYLYKKHSFLNTHPSHHARGPPHATNLLHMCIQHGLVFHNHHTSIRTELDHLQHLKSGGNVMGIHTCTAQPYIYTHTTAGARHKQQRSTNRRTPRPRYFANNLYMTNLHTLKKMQAIAALEPNF